jgi:Protein of unknown function (DUF3134)
MTPVYNNPALRQEPRNQPIKVAPLTGQESLFNWIEGIGRFHSSEVEVADFPDQNLSDGLEDILEPENYTQDAQENEEE